MKYLFFAFFFISFNGFGQEKAELFDSLFNIMHERSQFSGNVLIAENGKIIYTSSLGFSDRENQIPLTAQTLFNVGSVSKVFTAISILQLEERNRLNISENVSKYLPKFPYPSITIHHLLIHASGLPEDFTLLKNWDNQKIATNDDVFAELYRQVPALHFTPGEKGEYSNVGYMLLAEIVTKVSGQPFKEYLEKHIFEPAKMVKTEIYNAEEIKEIDNVALGYVFYPFTGKYEEAILLPEFASNYAMSGFQGDGNVYSSIEDLYKFYVALKKGELIDQRSLDRSFTKHIKGSEYGVSFGYGWTIANAPKLVVQRGGELPGYLANIIWNVDDDQLIIYLMNDYLAYLSYQRQIYPAYMHITLQNKLYLPPLVASVELTKLAVTGTMEEIKEKIADINNNPDLYSIDPPGLTFLVMKLQQMGNNEKAELILASFKPD